MDEDVTLEEVDEALSNVRAALVSAIDGKDSRAVTNLRKRIDQLLEARMVLTRDLPAAMSCVVEFSG